MELMAVLLGRKICRVHGKYYRTTLGQRLTELPAQVILPFWPAGVPGRYAKTVSAFVSRQIVEKLGINAGILIVIYDDMSS
jgi:hypothetical protein